MASVVSREPAAGAVLASPSSHAGHPLATAQVLAIRYCLGAQASAVAGSWGGEAGTPAKADLTLGRQRVILNVHNRARPIQRRFNSEEVACQFRKS